MKKIKSAKPEPARIVVECELSPETPELLTLTPKDRRDLNTMIFKDTRGRTRLATAGEPLLSNHSGPAISYPDGEEDFFINGWHAEDFQIPGFGESIDHTNTIIWEKPLGLQDFTLESAEVVASCNEDDHAWEVFLYSAEGGDEPIAVSINLKDLVLYSDIMSNNIEMHPFSYFHTLEFAHRLLIAFSEWVPSEGAYPFLKEESETRVLKEIKEQLEKLQRKPETSNDGGFGTAVAVGLAAAAVGAVGVLAKKAAAKQLSLNPPQVIAQNTEVRA